MEDKNPEGISQADKDFLKKLREDVRPALFYSRMRSFELNNKGPSKEELRNLLCDVAQLLDGWHQDGTAWTEYDESIRKRVSEMQQALEE